MIQTLDYKYIFMSWFLVNEGMATSEAARISNVQRSTLACRSSKCGYATNTKCTYTYVIYNTTCRLV